MRRWRIFLQKYLMKIAGQNFDNGIFDTEDLSTVRGGSLTLRNAMKGLEQAMKPHTALATISASGDSGIWSFEAADQTAADKVMEVARTVLPNAAELGLDDARLPPPPMPPSPPLFSPMRRMPCPGSTPASPGRSSAGRG